MILVLAYNGQQFDHWRRENGFHPTECRYITQEEQMRGWNPGAAKLVMLKDWQRNKSGQFCAVAMEMKQRLERVPAK